MDRYFEKYENLKNKSKKQKQMKEFESKYLVSKEIYLSLRNELIDDMNKLKEKVNEFNEYIEYYLLLSYNKFIFNVNMSWQSLSSSVDFNNSSIKTINLQPIYTSNDKSMIYEKNIHLKIEN